MVPGPLRKLFALPECRSCRCRDHPWQLLPPSLTLLAYLLRSACQGLHFSVHFVCSLNMSPILYYKLGGAVAGQSLHGGTQPQHPVPGTEKGLIIFAGHMNSK